jgi:hypothetical protein
MELKISTQQILKFLNFLSWIIFIGLCIDAGGIFFNSLFIYFINPEAARQSWNGVDLYDLYTFDIGYFFNLTILMSIVMFLKAFMFFIIIKTINHKNLDLAYPFKNKIKKSIANLSYIAFGIGMFSIWGQQFTDWLINLGVKMPAIKEIRFGGGDVWFFLFVILFAISIVFKRGIELQQENDLTI